MPSTACARLAFIVPMAVLMTATVEAADQVEQIELGKSVEGRPIVARLHGPDDAPQTVLLLASIHGSEPAGTPLLERFEAWLAEEPSEWAGTRVVVVPVANPDGYARRERTNQRGVDLNRNFPAGNRIERSVHGPAALSEPESQAIMRALKSYDPSRVLSLHQPLKCVDYDGPGEALARAISESIDGRLPVKKLGARPGSLGAYVGDELGKPIITLELRKAEEDRGAQALWTDYGPALIAFVRGTD